MTTVVAKKAKRWSAMIYEERRARKAECRRNHELSFRVAECKGKCGRLVDVRKPSGYCKACYGAQRGKQTKRHRKCRSCGAKGAPYTGCLCLACHTRAAEEWRAILAGLAPGLDPWAPTDALPGTVEKQAVLFARLESGLLGKKGSLHVPGDAVTATGGRRLVVELVRMGRPV